MKILQVTATFPPRAYGGVTTASLNIARGLKSRGHEVTVFTTDFGTRDSSTTRSSIWFVREEIDVRYYRNLSRILASARVFTPAMMLPALRRELDRYDIVHLHDYRSIASVAVHRFAHRAAIPYVLQAHGSITTPFQKGGLRSVFDLIWGPPLISDAAKLLAVAPLEAAQYEGLGADRRKVVVIPNGIDSKQFESIPERGSIRQRFGISNRTSIVLSLGRLHKTKRVDLLVRGFVGVLQRIDDAVLMIAGPDDGDLKTVLDTARELGIASKVVYAGPVREEEKLAFFVDADVFVLPSPYEVFGIVTLEALMCGTPVIVSEGCGIAEMIKENDFGLVAKSGSAAELQTAIIKTLLDRDTAREKALKAKEFIARNHDWGAIVERLEALYRECTQSG